MKKKIFDFEIDSSLHLIDINSRSLLINTINPHCYCEAKKDEFYKEALQNSDVLIPDGIGIVWAVHILKGVKINRIAGTVLHKYLLEKLNKTKGRVFYLGSTPSTLKLIEDKVKREYPNIIVDSFSPPYKIEFTEEENIQMVTAINVFQPDVVFVGMTAPKQEKWAYQHRNVLDTKIIASIGAVFDFYAETVKRPGLLWQKLGLEWLPRFLREPRRLWKRNFISTPMFIWDVLKEKYIHRND